MIIETILEDIQRITNDARLNALKDKSVLVSGGAGFIGSHLCDVLVKLGADVTCLDNFSTGLSENIDHLVGLRNFNLIKADVSSFESEERYDYVLHFASRASPENYQVHPIETLLANSFGTYKMLEHARKFDSTMFFASSSEVYGDVNIIPTPEKYWGNVNPLGVRSCYDEGKRFGEALLMAYHRQYGVDAKIVRIHNTYGPRLRADGNYARALSRFIAQALKGKDLTVYGDGSQTRSFCYVSDTVHGILLGLLSKQLHGDVINIGSQKEIRIIDLAEKIREIVGSKSKIVFRRLPEDDPRRRCPEISKAIRILGWTPRIGLDEGLARTIAWFRKQNRFLT